MAKFTPVAVVILGFENASESPVGKFVAANMTEMGFDFRFAAVPDEAYSFFQKVGSARELVIDPDWDFYLAPGGQAWAIFTPPKSKKMAIAQEAEKTRMRERLEPGNCVFVLRQLGADWTVPCRSSAYTLRGDERDGERFQNAFVTWLVEQDEEEAIF